MLNAVAMEIDIKKLSLDHITILYNTKTFVINMWSQKLADASKLSFTLLKPISISGHINMKKYLAILLFLRNYGKMQKFVACKTFEEEI